MAVHGLATDLWARCAGVVVGLSTGMLQIRIGLLRVTCPGKIQEPEKKLSSPHWEQKERTHVEKTGGWLSSIFSQNIDYDLISQYSCEPPPAAAGPRSESRMRKHSGCLTWLLEQVEYF